MHSALSGDPMAVQQTPNEQTLLAFFCHGRFAGLSPILEGLLVSDLEGYTEEKLTKLVKDWCIEEQHVGKLHQLVLPFLQHKVFVGGQQRTLASFLQPAEPKQKKPKAEVSPWKSHFGHAVVSMTVDGVLGYVMSLQRDGKLRQSDMIHSEIELALKLCDRDAARQVMVDAFRKRRQAFAATPTPPQDRTEYPVVVCSGMKGLGKTRMLEEWPTLFRDAGIAEPHLGVFVSYGNGNAPQPFESRMPIQASFGWRMLHRLFIEDNCSEATSRWFDREFLPSNADDLLLHTAVQVIHAGAERFGTVKPGQTLSLFIGIDEYQAIPVGPEYDANADDQRKARERTFLWQLMAALDDCRKLHAHGLHLYLGCAGTQWGPLSIAGSSLPETERVPLTLLTSQAIEDVIRSNVDLQARLESPDFRRKLFFLGGVPRPSVKFALGESFDTVWDKYVVQRWKNLNEGLSDDELVRLIATAVSGIRIDPAKNSKIKDRTWGRLFEEGLCLPLDDQRLSIPYCVFRLAAAIESRTLSELPARCLIQNVQYLCEHVDNVLYDNEPWQLWGKFGACFFAMRVNAFLLMGFRECHAYEFFDSAIVNGCNYKVELRPVEVHAIEEDLSAALPAFVTEKKHRRALNWVKGEGGIGYCLINGTGGRGVDVFCALPLAMASKGEVVLYLDQRKVEARGLGEQTAGKLLAKANIVPACLPAGSQTIRGLFSILASFNQQAEQLPKDSFVLSYQQHKAFHGTLASHPACRSFVDVNYDNVSTLRLLKSMAPVAEAVIEHRSKAKFGSVDEFAAFCQQHGRALSVEDRARVVAYKKEGAR